MKRSELIARGDEMAKRIHGINAADPGKRAALRRGLGRRPEDIANFHAHAIVTRYLPDGQDEATERAFYTVAALIAAQPRDARDQETGPDAAEPEAREEEAAATGSASVREEETEGAGAESPAETGEDTEDTEPKRRNLGETLARAVESGAVKGDTAPDRLHLLARYRTDRLHRELPKLIAHLRADLVPIDWGYLLRDLACWGRERDRVAKEWVQQYHRTRHQLEQKRKNLKNSPDGTDPNGSENA